MTLYVAALFLHIAGALAMFSALGAELAALRGATLARSANLALAALESYRLNRVLGPIAVLLILLPGGYMAAATTGMTPWIWTALGAMAALVVIGATVLPRLLAAVGPTLQRAFDGPDARRLVRRMWASFVARVLLLLGIVTLMTTKPDWPGALSVLGVVAVIAATAWLALARAARRDGRTPGEVTS